MMEVLPEAFNNRTVASLRRIGEFADNSGEYKFEGVQSDGTPHSEAGKYITVQKR